MNWSIDGVDKKVTDTNGDEKRQEQVANILDKKETGRPITAEDYVVLDHLIREVEGRIIAQRAESYAEVRRQRAEIRKQIPEVAWHLDLDELDLPGRIHNLLLDNEIETVGDVLLILETGEERLLEFRGFGDVLLASLKEYVDAYEMPELVIVEEDKLAVEAEAGVALGEEAVVEDAAPEAVEEEAVVDVIEDQETKPAKSEEPVLAEEAAPDDEEEISEEEESVTDIDDLSRSLVEVIQEPVKEKKKGKIVVVSPISDAEDEKSAAKRGRSYVFDEDAGEVVVKRKRKGSRQRSDWEEFDENDLG